MRWCVDQPVFCRPAATPETVHRMRLCFSKLASAL